MCKAATDLSPSTHATSRASTGSQNLSSPGHDVRMLSATTVLATLYCIHYCHTGGRPPAPLVSFLQCLSCAQVSREVQEERVGKSFAGHSWLADFDVGFVCVVVGGIADWIRGSTKY